MQRLNSADDETTWSAAARIATERLRDITPRQLKLLALIALSHTDPFRDGGLGPIPADMQQEAYFAWLARVAEPFADFAFDRDDVAQLRSLGLLHFDEDAARSDHGHTPAVLNPFATTYYIGSAPASLNKAYRMFSKFASTGDFDAIPIDFAILSPAGQLLARSSLNNILGE